MTTRREEHRAVRQQRLDDGPARPAVVTPTQNPIPLVRFAEQANQVRVVFEIKLFADEIASRCLVGTLQSSVPEQRGLHVCRKFFIVIGERT